MICCSVRDWTRICYVIGFENILIHLSTRYRIRWGFFFPLWKADLKISGFAVEFAGCVWTVGVSGKKKLQIQKYPDTCWRGLRSDVQTSSRSRISLLKLDELLIILKRYILKQRKKAQTFLIPLVINIIMSYFQDQRKCYSLLFMELSVFIEDSVLVQFARSFAVLLG